MSHIVSFSKTVTLSTLGAYTGYSSEHLNGLIREVHVQVSTSTPTSALLTITSTSTGNVILKAKDPGAGTYYYPHRLAQGTTGAAIASSGPAPIALVNDRLRLNFSSSSGIGSETVTMRMLLDGSGAD